MSRDYPAPPPLTDRMRIALDQVKLARESGDVDREWYWADRLDRLIDKYISEQTPM